MILKPQEITGPRGFLNAKRTLLLISLIITVGCLHYHAAQTKENRLESQIKSESITPPPTTNNDEINISQIKKKISNRPTSKNRKISDPEYQAGKDFVKHMMANAWQAYYKYAKDFDELNPLSRTGNNFFGRESLALTAIDSLDSLLIMGLQEEFLQAKTMALSVSFDKEMKISLFESNIRIIGGLLSAFALTGDGMFVSKAFDLANRYNTVFERGLFPIREVDLMANLKVPNNNTKPPQQNVVILAEAGTLTVEFAYLAHIIKDRSLIDEAVAVIEKLGRMTSPYPGLLPRLIQTQKTEQSGGFFGVGGMADSYYEYLLKYYIQTGDTLHKILLDRALEGIQKYLIKEIDGRLYIIGLDNEREDMIQEHLSCFIGGFFGLAGQHLNRSDLIKLGGAITESCYEMYHKQEIGLSPEMVHVPSMTPKNGEWHYIQRPEVVESLFVMYRVTGDVKYRQWGWEIAQNIEKHCSVEPSSFEPRGYHSFYDVTNAKSRKKDRQESFFMAETLKYLYLLFCDRSFLPLDQWVFNTEAHPLPVIRNND